MKDKDFDKNGFGPGVQKEIKKQEKDDIGSVYNKDIDPKGKKSARYTNSKAKHKEFIPVGKDSVVSDTSNSERNWRLMGITIDLKVKQAMIQKGFLNEDTKILQTNDKSITFAIRMAVFLSIFRLTDLCDFLRRKNIDPCVPLKDKNVMITQAGIFKFIKLLFPEEENVKLLKKCNATDITAKVVKDFNLIKKNLIKIEMYEKKKHLVINPDIEKVSESKFWQIIMTGKIIKRKYTKRVDLQGKSKSTTKTSSKSISITDIDNAFREIRSLLKDGEEMTITFRGTGTK